MAGFAIVLALVAGEMQSLAATDEGDLIGTKPRVAAVDNAPSRIEPDQPVEPKLALRRRLQKAERMDLEYYRDSGTCDLTPECEGMAPEDVTYIAHQLLKTMSNELTSQTKTGDKSSAEDEAWDRMMDVWGIVIGIGGVAATSAGAFTAYWLGRRQGSQSAGGRRTGGGRTRANNGGKIRSRNQAPTPRRPPQQGATP